MAWWHEDDDPRDAELARLREENARLIAERDALRKFVGRAREHAGEIFDDADEILCTKGPSK